MLSFYQFHLGEKMKQIILIIILSFVLFSCSKEESDDSATTELEGTWETDCYQYSNSQYNKKTIVVSGKNYTYTSVYYSSSKCATVEDKWVSTLTSLAIGDAMFFSTYGSSGGYGHQFTAYHNSTKLEWQSAGSVSWANTNSYCGLSNWVINVAQDVSGKTCGSSTEWSSGITLYGLYLLDGTKLLPSISSSSYPSSVSTEVSNTFNKK